MHSSGRLDEVPATVTSKGCTYTLGAPADAEALQGWMSLSSECVMEMSASFTTECKMKIKGPQELQSIKYKNLNFNPSSFETEINPEATALAFTSEGKGCASAEVPETGWGEYLGKTTASGLLIEEPGSGVWHTRPVGEAGSGVDASQMSTEKIQSKGGESKLASKIGGEAASLSCAESKGEGVLYNGVKAGQAKLLVGLEKCTTTLKHCIVAEPISIQADLHLSWKWNGMKSSLQQGSQQIFGQKPGMLLTHSDVEAGPPKGEEELTSIKMKKDGVGTCSAEGPALALKGYEAADLEPQSIEQFSKEPKLTFSPGKHLQHYWNGEEETGLETTLKLGTEPAELTSKDTLAPIRTTAGEELEVGVFDH